MCCSDLFRKRELGRFHCRTSCGRMMHTRKETHSSQWQPDKWILGSEAREENELLYPQVCPDSGTVYVSPSVSAFLVYSFLVDREERRTLRKTEG